MARPLRRRARRQRGLARAGARRQDRAVANSAPDDLHAALTGLLPWPLRRRLDTEAPTHFEAPTGTNAAIDYEAEAGPTISIRLQELFGLATHPTIAGGRIPLVIELLSPAHRPVQVTRDLPGFWRGSYAAVRSRHARALSAPSLAGRSARRRPDPARQAARHLIRNHMDLHTAGHRRGVVAAPHHAAAEAGRAILAEGGNALEAMVAMAATIAAVYPHMNHIGGDGFWLVREPSGRVRALMGARAGRREGDAGALSRARARRDPAARAARGAHRAGGDRRLDAGAARPPRRIGGRMPLDVLLGAAIRHAREGYTVTRSQARLTAEKLAECKDAPGFAATFSSTASRRPRARRCRQTALAATLEQLAHAGLQDFYRGDVGREIAADLERIGSPVTRGDLEKYQASVAEPLSVALQAGTLYNTPPPTQGLASLMILALFERLRVTRGRKLRSRARPDRGDQARVPRARPVRHRPGAARRIRPTAISTRRSSMPRRTRSTAQGRALAGAARARATRSGWARRIRPASSSPISSRSIGSSAPPACCRAPAC